MIRTFLMSDPVVQRLGWVLVHSLWEGALVALLLAWALHRLRRRLPDARYVISCAALARDALRRLLRGPRAAGGAAGD